jgi:hypothetical protein
MMGDNQNPTKTSRIRWNAVFAGVVIATALGILLNMLGLGIGLTNLTADAEQLENIAVSSVIWWTISGIIAMFIGGFAVGRLSNITNTLDSVMNSLTMWSVSTILGLLFVGSSLGLVISGTADLVGSGLTAIGEAGASLTQSASNVVGQNMPDMSGPLNNITDQADQLIKQAKDKVQTNSVDQMSNDINQAISQWLNADDDQKQQAQQKVADLLVKYTDTSKAKAQQTVQNWQTTYQNAKDELNQQVDKAKQKAAEATEQAGNVFGGVALVSFFILLLGAAASTIGGVIGGRSKA